MSDAMIAERQITQTRLLPAPPEAVWPVWTQKEHVDQWWGPNGFTTETREMDVRPGGTWVFTMTGHGQTWPNKVTYLEVEAPPAWSTTTGTSTPPTSASP